MSERTPTPDPTPPKDGGSGRRKPSGRGGSAGSGRVQGDPCGPFREAASAALDGELPAAEQAALDAHLAGCPACRAHGARIQRLVDALHQVGPIAPALPPALAAVDPLARLQERLLAADGPAPVGGAAGWVPGRVGWVLAAAAVVLLVGIVAALRPERFPAPSEAPRPPSGLAERPPEPAPELLPPPPEVPPAEDPPPEAPSVPPPEDTQTDDPPQDPPAQVPPQDPPQDPPPELPPDPPAAPDPTPPPDTGPTRVRKPEGPVAPIQVAFDEKGLKNLIAQITNEHTPAAQRPNMILSMGVPKFADRLAYRFLAGVLDGDLDRLTPGFDEWKRTIGPNECREAAFLALGRFGNEPAAKVLLAAPLRAPPLGDRDRAALLGALSSLREDAAIGLVAEALENAQAGRDEERFLLVRALAALSHPVGAPALTGLFEGKRRPPPWLRREAGGALGACGNPKSLEPLLTGLEEKRPAVRQGAALGLGRLARRRLDVAPACLGALMRALEDKDRSVAEAAVRGLGASGLEAAIPVLIERLDPEVEGRRAVRGLASEELVLLTGKVFVDPSEARAWWARGWLRPVPTAIEPRRDVSAVMLPPGLRSPFRIPDAGEGLVFVLDVSGSMTPPKWDLVKRELGRGLDALAARDRKERAGIELLPFASAPRPVFRSLVRAHPDNVADAKEALEAQRPVPVAQTDIAKAIGQALLYEGVDTIYVVTDGADSTQDLDAVLWQVARANRSRDRAVRIHAVLVRDGGPDLHMDERPGSPDEPWDVTFMRRLARENGGRFVYSGR